MSAAAEAEPLDSVAPRKRSKLPLVIGLVLALAGGAGGFLAIRSGLLGGAGGDEVGTEPALAQLPTLAPASFVALDPIVINLPPDSGRRFLRFIAQIEVVPEFADEVDAIRPRITDVLNTYLRAVEISDLETPSALTMLRAQMLRRVQVVAGAGRVRDLLVMEFLLD